MHLLIGLLQILKNSRISCVFKFFGCVVYTKAGTFDVIFHHIDMTSYRYDVMKLRNETFARHDL